MKQLRSWHWSTLKVVSEPMSALARTSERDGRTRTTNENCTANESWTRTKYSYDAVGNRTASLGVSSYTNNSSNEMTATSSASYTYDYNGNSLTKVVGSNTTSYAWDYENRMTSVTLPGSGGTVTLKYDPFGRRIYKSSSSATSVFAYDGDNLVEETNASGTAVARYSQGLNIDEPLAMLRSSTTSYYQADGLGSVTSLSNSSGALANTYTYDSFGKQTASTGSLVNPFQYTARESDPETGLYYYRARYYDANPGRFLTEDLIRFRAGKNFYSYVHNRPLDLRDPKGWLAWGGGLTGGGMGGLFWFGGGAEGSLLVVGDSQGNSGLLWCSAGGLGAVNGATVSGQFTSVVCPTCNTICDMENGFVQVQGFAGVGATGAVGGGASIGMSNGSVFASGGGGVGAGAGLVVMGGSCKLLSGGKSCKNCPATQK